MWIDDQILENAHLDLVVKSFVPEATFIVLGRSNSAEKEIQLEECLKDKVPILRRAGGGGTVLLYSGCSILSLGIWVKDFYRNDFYFNLINSSLSQLVGRNSQKNIKIEPNGISDLCVGSKKVCGTSLFRSRNYLLFQASFLCELDLSPIVKYLKHPSIEPGYREKRNHSDFLLGLSTLDAKLSASHLTRLFNGDLPGLLRKQFGEHLIDPIDKQIIGLKNKIIRDQKIESLK